MNVEQRLVDALRTADQVEPSPDLWSRVLHSIEEDQTHRRRVVTSMAVTLATVAGLIVVGALSLTDGPAGRFVRLPVMELIETIALVVLVAVLGPAIQRFGRGYATDLWPATPSTATSLVRLLDIAYLLVFGGYILLTAGFDFGTSATRASECLLRDVNCATVQSQLESAGHRVGGLILIMGLLHAVTIMVLPVVALVSNSTRVGRALPKWLVVVLLLVGIVVGGQGLLMLIGGLVGMAGS
ncbi:MAG: hypothetical protein IZT58_12525 [Actinobacteria bacterium]|nr:hypothetical protein [Actinomycetota bacterium]